MVELVADTLWQQIEPLLPPFPPKSSKGGCPPVPHRKTLAGIIFVLKAVAPWQCIPKDLQCGIGSTCSRRFAEWTRLEVLSRFHTLLVREIGKSGAAVLEQALIDSASVRAVFWGTTRTRTPRTVKKRGANSSKWKGNKKNWRDAFGHLVERRR
jgi:transposase